MSYSKTLLSLAGLIQLTDKFSFEIANEDLEAVLRLEK